MKFNELNNSKVLTEFVWIIISVAVGTVFSFNLISDLLFNIASINYISNDMIVNFVGWHYYRYDPWMLPITRISSLVYPVGTNLIYSDSIPILSVALKLFSQLLPPVFVWHGLVAIINLSLLFYSGNLFFRIMTKDKLLGFIGGMFLLLSAPAIYRLIAHYSLTSQWLLVFNLLLLFQRNQNVKQNSVWQLFLIFLSCGIHPYLAIMNLGLSFGLAYKLSFIRIKNDINMRFSAKYFILLAIIYVITFLCSAYIFGWFVGGGKSDAFGYGYYSANVLSLFNPEFGALVIPNLSIGQYQYEGYSYLGLGIILPLIFLCLFNYKRIYLAFLKKEMYLFYVLIAVFTMLAFSNILQISNFVIRLPYHGKIFDIFRSSGRFIWILYYIIILLVILGFYNKFAKKKYGIFLLIGFLFLQYVDLKPLLNLVIRFHSSNQIGSAVWNSDLKSKFWYTLNESGYKHMVIVETHPGDVDRLSGWWGDRSGYPAIYKFVLLASLSQITIDDMHLARRTTLQDQFVFKVNQDFSNGILADSTIYIVPPQIYILLNQQEKNKFCTAIDGYNICAKNKIKS
ncbi:MAG: hypothetical protein E6Q32_07150 [Neisseriales bacterium]|nr:MAG: hypothetical protein E6Q32_07150 [Neisseriales bacterium]HRG63722.1 DUF6311 domain-containing protein [Burkholderiales bacterium]